MQIKFTSQKGIHNIAADQIIRIEALNNYSKIFLANHSTLVVSKVLMWCQNRLPEQMFTRVHRSHLVNKTYISEINFGDHKMVRLTNGDKVTISRRKSATTFKNLAEVKAKHRF
ncbi:MAG: LytTR family DNA-binding domain-containing protein [Bacteroidota bacterium]